VHDTAIVRLRGGRWPAAPVASAAALAVLIAANALQNGRADRAAPRITSQLHSARDVAAICQRKCDVVALWRSGTAPQPRALSGRRLRGALLWRGVLCPASALVTHVLFAPGHAWVGKEFAADGTGRNVFADGRCRRPFAYAVAPSAFDGRPALVLTYRRRDRLWGNALGMRDELRTIPGHPRILIGMGSMVASGGVRNTAPFVLELAP